MQESSESAATQAEATLKETRESAEAAAARATADYDSLRRVLDAVNAQKAELDSRLAKAGGALNAAEELREAKCVPHLLGLQILHPPLGRRSRRRW